MRFVVLGTTDFTLSCILGLIDRGCTIVGLISLPPNLLPNNSVSLVSFCLQRGIPYAEYGNINSLDAIQYLMEIKPDYILSTWPHLLSKDVLAIPKYFVIGSHPTPLPMSRGRHPLHWMLVLGIPNSALTFFIMQEGIDDGDIIFQKYFSVGDTINSANEMVSTVARRSIAALVSILRDNPSYSGYPQGEENINYWRKRDEHDVTIDPRMNSSIVQRIVNSFKPPYPGAILKISKKNIVRLVDVSPVERHMMLVNWINYEHGYIFYHDENTIVMRFDDAVLQLKFAPSGIRVECGAGKKIHPPSFYAD